MGVCVILRFLLTVLLFSCAVGSVDVASSFSFEGVRLGVRRGVVFGKGVDGTCSGCCGNGGCTIFEVQGSTFGVLRGVGFVLVASVENV